MLTLQQGLPVVVAAQPHVRALVLPGGTLVPLGSCSPAGGLCSRRGLWSRWGAVVPLVAFGPTKEICSSWGVQPFEVNLSRGSTRAVFSQVTAKQTQGAAGAAAR